MSTGTLIASHARCRSAVARVDCRAAAGYAQIARGPVAADADAAASRRDGVPRRHDGPRRRSQVGSARGAPRPIQQAARPVAHPDRPDVRAAGGRDGRRRSCFPTPTDLKQAGVGPAARRLRARVRDRRAVRRCRGRAARRARRSGVACAIRRATTRCAIAPVTRPTEWTLRVVASDARGQPPSTRDVFETIAFGTRRGPRRRTPPCRAVIAPGESGVASPVSRRRARDASTTSASPERPAAIWGPSDFLQFIQQRRSRRQGDRAVRGPRAAGHPAARPPRRPRAEPDAVRAADDSDQPRDHRRRRAGRLARRGASCSARLRRGDGARLRRARPDRHPHGGHVRHHQRVAVVQPRDRRCCSSCSGSRCST